MNRKMIAGALVAAMGMACGSAMAQQASAAPLEGARVAPERIALDRSAMVEVILGTWEGSEHATDGDGRLWRETMRPVLEAADEANLRRAMDALEFPSMLAALQGQLDGPRVSPSALGDPSSDLVYTPIEPCRILDTRVAGGPIGAQASRSFDGSAHYDGDFEFQGGASSDCGIPTDRPSAVMLNITVVNPQGAGYLTAYPFGASVPLAASLNYQSGDVIGNEVLVTMNPAGLFDFRIYSFRQAHVVADAVGYFMAPQATALDCVSKTDFSTVAANSSVSDFLTPVCDAGYQAVSGDCSIGAGGISRGTSPFPFGDNAVPTRWACSITNPTGSSVSFGARTTCCRVPGR